MSIGLFVRRNHPQGAAQVLKDTLFVFDRRESDGRTLHEEVDDPIMHLALLNHPGNPGSQVDDHPLAPGLNRQFLREH